jgi:hypothetical protein
MKIDGPSALSCFVSYLFKLKEDFPSFRGHAEICSILNRFSQLSWAMLDAVTRLYNKVIKLKCFSRNY